MDEDKTDSEIILEGVKPKSSPFITQAYEDLQKKVIDILVDAIKYVASSCGIVIAIYSQILQSYLKDPHFNSEPIAKLLLFAPLLVWFGVIIGTIIGIFPRAYEAKTDYEKQVVIQKINKIKSRWLIAVLVLFGLGFVFFIYIMFSQIWELYPFNIQLTNAKTP